MTAKFDSTTFFDHTKKRSIIDCAWVGHLNATLPNILGQGFERTNLREGKCAVGRGGGLPKGFPGGLPEGGMLKLWTDRRITSNANGNNLVKFFVFVRKTISTHLLGSFLKGCIAKGNDIGRCSFGSLGYIFPHSNMVHCRRSGSAVKTGNLCYQDLHRYNHLNILTGLNPNRFQHSKVTQFAISE